MRTHRPLENVNPEEARVYLVYTCGVDFVDIRWLCIRNKVLVRVALRYALSLDVRDDPDPDNMIESLFLNSCLRRSTLRILMENGYNISVRAVILAVIANSSEIFIYTFFKYLSQNPSNKVLRHQQHQHLLNRIAMHTYDHDTWSVVLSVLSFTGTNNWQHILQRYGKNRFHSFCSQKYRRFSCRLS